MPRETTNITTPFGKATIELKAYLTGREKRAIRDIFLNDKLADSEKFNKAQDLSFTTVINSIDGKPEDIVSRVLDMRSEDYNFVVDAINDVTKDKAFEEKKTP
jgi:hypothetical protein